MKMKQQQLFCQRQLTFYYVDFDEKGRHRLEGPRSLFGTFSKFSSRNLSSRMKRWPFFQNDFSFLIYSRIYPSFSNVCDLGIQF